MNLNKRVKKQDLMMLGIFIVIIFGIMSVDYLPDKSIVSNVINQVSEVNKTDNIKQEFGIEILITEDFKVIHSGERVEAIIKLVPTGIKPDSKVVLSYYLVDENGERVAVDLGEEQISQITGQISRDKIINTEGFVPGNYDLYIEIKYESDLEENLSATAKSGFIILEGERPSVREFAGFSSYQISLFLISVVGLILIVLIIIMIIKINRFNKKKR